MSINAAIICCTGCDYKAVNAIVPMEIVYRMQDGREVAGGREKGWCYKCNGYTDIEGVAPEYLRDLLLKNLKEKRELEAQVTDASRRLIWSLFHRAQRQRMRDMLERVTNKMENLSYLLEVTLTRKARPRCLKCGSDNAVRLSFGEDNLTHDFRHSCGGRLRIIKDGAGRPCSVSLTRYVLNTEGEVLEKRRGW